MQQINSTVHGQAEGLAETLDLMPEEAEAHRAAAAAAELAVAVVPQLALLEPAVTVMCGPGADGDDGGACIAIANLMAAIAVLLASDGLADAADPAGPPTGGNSTDDPAITALQLSRYHTLTLSLSLTHTHTHSLTHIPSLSDSFSLTLSLSDSLTLSLSMTLSLTRLFS